MSQIFTPRREFVVLTKPMAIKARHGTVYKLEDATNALYMSSGTSMDWAYSKAGVKYSYTLELRPSVDDMQLIREKCHGMVLKAEFA